MPPIVPPDPVEPAAERGTEPRSPALGEAPQAPSNSGADPEYFANRFGGDLGLQITACARSSVMRTCGWIPQKGRDFIEEASGILARKLLESRPDFGRLEAKALGWAQTCLDRAWIDQCRQSGRSREESGSELDDYSDPGPDAVPFDQEEDSYPPEVLDQIQLWGPMQRVGLLTYVWVWRRVPEAIWDGWAEECKLERPFPPEKILVWTGRREWHRSVAAALRMSPRQFTLLLNRSQHLLSNLPQIPWLGPGNTLPGRGNPR